MKFLYDDHVAKYDIYSEIVAVVVILKSSRLSKKRWKVLLETCNAHTVCKKSLRKIAALRSLRY